MDARPRMLVVDDEPYILQAFVRCFRKTFEIALAADAEQALELLAKREFDLLLVDYSMPGKDGLELLAHAAEHYPRMGRLLVTAHHDRAEVQNACRLGLAAEVIAKPWSRADVLARVGELLRPTRPGSDE